MSVKFNASEIFEMGIEIEKNGKAFYSEAAKRVSEAEIKKLFGELADWEDQHVTTFEKLKSNLSGQALEETIYDPDNEMHLYLKAAADSHVFLNNADAKNLAAGCHKAKDALKLAMGFEKDSVVLYRAMEELVPENLGRSDIGKLILEELKHINILYVKLAKLG